MRLFVCDTCDETFSDRMFFVRSGRGVRLSTRCLKCRTPSATLEQCPDCLKKTHVMDFVVFPKGGKPPIRKTTCTMCRYASKEKDTMRAIYVDNPNVDPDIPLGRRWIPPPKPPTMGDKVKEFFEWMTDGLR